MEILRIVREAQTWAQQEEAFSFLFQVGRVKVNGFQTLWENRWFVVPKTDQQNCSLLKKCIFSSNFHCLRWEVFWIIFWTGWTDLRTKAVWKTWLNPLDPVNSEFALLDLKTVHGSFFDPILSRQTTFNISWGNDWKWSTKFNCFFESVNQSGQTRATLYSWMFPASSKLFHFLLNYS